MAKIIRKTASIFGGGLSAGSHQVEQFGSKVQLGSPTYTVDPAVIQGLAAWVDGWVAAIDSGTKAPYVQDMNAVCLVLAYQIAYILQEGLSEWDSGTTYYTNGVVQSGGQWFVSVVDNNIGNAPVASTTNAFWQWVTPPVMVPSGSIPANSIPKVSGSSTSGPAGSKTMVAGLLSDDGTNVVIGGTPGVNGLKYADGTVQKTAAVSVVTGQANLGPSGSNTRALGTNYQNTGTKPIFVTVSAGGGGSGVGIEGFTDNNAAPTTLVAIQYQNGSGVGGFAHIFFIVLPGNYYRVVNVFGASGIQAWIEWS